jgi:DNA polymerase III epsilon subunit-like protein
MIVVDVETSGLNPKRHSILSIGAVNFLNPADLFYGECKVRPGAEVQEMALLINGFTIKEINDRRKQSLESLLIEFRDWSKKVRDRIPAGHNISFDLSFLNESANMYEIKIPFKEGEVNIQKLVNENLDTPKRRALQKNNNCRRLDNALLYVGLKEEPRPHNALTGAKLEAEVISRLTRGQFLFKEYKKMKIPRYLL